MKRRELLEMFNPQVASALFGLSKAAQRDRLALELRAHIQGQFTQKLFCSGREFQLMNRPHARQHIAGQRVALAKFDVGLDAERLEKALDKMAAALVPWDAPQPPNVYRDRRWNVVEVAYPDAFQERDIPLSSAGARPQNGLILGKNAAGNYITLYLNDMVHTLIGGATNSGKSWTMRCLATQAALNGKNQIVLIDGKRGEGLGIVNGLPGQVAPIAMQDDDAVNALGWVYNLMLERYQAIQNNGGRAIKWDSSIVVMLDEFQHYTKRDRVPAFVWLLAALSQQGRAAGIKLVVGTQKPTSNEWGSDPSVRDQYTTRIGLAVETFQASNSIMGGNTPRCDKLLGFGDGYGKSKIQSGELCERLQMVYIPEAELSRAAGGEPQLREYPEFDTSVLGDDGEKRGRPRVQYTEDQQAAAVVAAQAGYGRDKFKRLLKANGYTVPGNTQADALMKWGRRVNTAMEHTNLPA